MYAKQFSTSRQVYDCKVNYNKQAIACAFEKTKKP